MKAQGGASIRFEVLGTPWTALSDPTPYYFRVPMDLVGNDPTFPGDRILSLCVFTYAPGLTCSGPKVRDGF